MTETHPADPAASARGLNRRQVLTAGVWATPVVVLATAAPAAAASVSGAGLNWLGSFENGVSLQYNAYSFDPAGNTQPFDPARNFLRVTITHPFRALATLSDGDNWQVLSQNDTQAILQYSIGLEGTNFNTSRYTAPWGLTPGVANSVTVSAVILASDATLTVAGPTA